MAGANETPRNKLIALMYLVFITMLALNVSKEVLDGFGQMFKKILGFLYYGAFTH